MLPVIRRGASACGDRPPVIASRAWCARPTTLIAAGGSRRGAHCAQSTFLLLLLLFFFFFFFFFLLLLLQATRKHAQYCRQTVCLLQLQSWALLILFNSTDHSSFRENVAPLRHIVFCTLYCYLSMLMKV
uniref:Uncharacterized protein n=1 Tax=Setaria italica TaxID=4555 RepID=K3YDY3_SETIT